MIITSPVLGRVVEDDDDNVKLAPASVAVAERATKLHSFVELLLIRTELVAHVVVKAGNWPL